MYTKGEKPSAYDVIASVGGASGSLIGLLGMAIAMIEVVAFTNSKLRGAAGRKPTASRTSDGASGSLSLDA